MEEHNTHDLVNILNVFILGVGPAHALVRYLAHRLTVLLHHGPRVECLQDLRHPLSLYLQALPLAAPLSALFALPSRRAASSTPSLTRDLMYILCQQRSSSSVQLGFLQLSASPRVFL
ncbi:hypothetical protein SAY87_027679 [Trapa incisa]|uniref:Uncharacterized protein n=1 Tax=Trapa incisa TaxID=236973 RepID=A0AAN7PQV9_9MYRT|nr:hypothetical protein SAY87_027679 [Trapa incisa]